MLLSSSLSLTTGASTKTSHTHTHMFTRNFVCSQASVNGYSFDMLFFWRDVRDYLSGCIFRQQFWKKNLFWDTLDSKKGVQAKKRERHHFGMILPLQHITTVNSYNSSTVFTHCQGTANAPCPNLRWFYLRRRKPSKLLATWLNVAPPFSRFRKPQIAEVRCWKLWAPQVGSEKGIEFDKGKSAKWNTFCHNKKWYILLYIFTFQCISWNIYMLNHVELIGKNENWQPNAWVGSFWG